MWLFDSDFYSRDIKVQGIPKSKASESEAWHVIESVDTVLNGTMLSLFTFLNDESNNVLLWKTVILSNISISFESHWHIYFTSKNRLISLTVFYTLSQKLSAMGTKLREKMFWCC